MNLKTLLKSLLFSLTCFTSLIHAANYPAGINEQKILANARNLEPQALQYAIKGYQWALEHRQINNPNILTVIDFNLPSDQRRLWVIDLRSSRVLMNEYTTQGKESGSYYARHFSNNFGADATSLGVYKTLNAYLGKHGLSERLEGLEQGINSNAYARAVVIHPAWYASPSFINENHRAGCSWGCFGINPAASERFINLTKNGSVIFAYASQERGDRNLEEV